MTIDRARWADWNIDLWCPLTGALPGMEWMSELEHEGRAAGLIRRARQDFFSLGTASVETVDAANINLRTDFDEWLIAPDEVAAARLIFADAMRIEMHALWSFDNVRELRSGERTHLSFGQTMDEVRNGKSIGTEAELLTALKRAIRDTIDFANERSAVHGQPRPHAIADWATEKALAILAIHHAVMGLEGLLAEYMDATRESQIAWLSSAQATDRLARHYMAEAQADAVTESIKRAPAERGRRARGIAKPSRKSPLRNALELLVADGLDNAQIFNALGDADRISTRAAHGFPIEVCDTEDSILSGGMLRWYATGASSDSATETPLKTLRNQLSKIRNPG